MNREAVGQMFREVERFTSLQPPLHHLCLSYASPVLRHGRGTGEVQVWKAWHGSMMSAYMLLKK